MAKTRHIQSRMNQRAIDQELLSLAASFGVVQERGEVDKYILGRKTLDATLRRLDRLRGKLLKARDKGGVVLVTGDDGVEVTTYRLDSYSKRLRKDS